MELLCFGNDFVPSASMMVSLPAVIHKPIYFITPTNYSEFCCLIWCKSAKQQINIINRQTEKDSSFPRLSTLWALNFNLYPTLLLKKDIFPIN